MSVRARTILFALFLSLVGLVSVAGTPPAPTSVPAPATSPPSPSPPSGDEEVERLDGELLELLDTYRWQKARWGILVVSLDTGDTLFARNPDSLMAPASNMKLVTSVAALHTLQPEYRFRTYLVTDGSVRDGVLNGDLILYGTGDPGISDRMTPSRNHVFQALVDQLVKAGVRRVTGDLVADASFLAGPLRPEEWDPADLNDHYAPGVSALSFNENVVSVRLEAAPRAGLAPFVHTIPDHAGLRVENHAVTVAGRPDPRVSITRTHPLDPVLIEGEIQQNGQDVWRQLTVPVPALYAGSVFRSVLERSGITLEGDLRRVAAPARSVVSDLKVSAPVRSGRPRTRILARYGSRPLRDYLAVMNKESNNLFAELLFRLLGRVGEGVGSPDAGARAVIRSLAVLGIDTDDLVQIDGSGLSEANRMSPGFLVSLLRHEARSPLWQEFWETLPEAGRRRELSRMYRTAAAHNLRAKTGTIEGVSALTGVVRSREGERLAFSILVNGTPSAYAAKRVEDEIGARLASFRRGAATASSRNGTN